LSCSSDCLHGGDLPRLQRPPWTFALPLRARPRTGWPFRDVVRPGNSIASACWTLAPCPPPVVWPHWPRPLGARGPRPGVDPKPGHRRRTGRAGPCAGPETIPSGSDGAGPTLKSMPGRAAQQVSAHQKPAPPFPLGPREFGASLFQRARPPGVPIFPPPRMATRAVPGTLDWVVTRP